MLTDWNPTRRTVTDEFTALVARIGDAETIQLVREGQHWVASGRIKISDTDRIEFLMQNEEVVGFDTSPDCPPLRSQFDAIIMNDSPYFIRLLARWSDRVLRASRATPDARRLAEEFARRLSQTTQDVAA